VANSTLPIKDRNIIRQIKNYYQNRNNYRDLLLFCLAINSGMKLVDLLKLNIKDVKNASILKLKSGLEIALSAEIKELIKKNIGSRKQDEPLFVSRFNKRFSRYAALTSFKEACKELNITYSVNSWRKTFGYHYYQKYHDLIFLQWYFSQNTVEQTLNYINVQESLSARFQGCVEL